MPEKRIVVISDLHCGSVIGLTPPAWHSERYSMLQSPLWNWYEAEVDALERADLLIVNGDAVDGEGKAETLDHITTDIEEQADIAVKCIRQIKADQVMMTYGTPFHTSGTMSYENLIARTLGCEIKDTLFLDVNGLKFSFRHVTGGSGTPYTQGTQAYKEAVRDLITAVENNEEPADVIIRSHVHNCFRAESPERVAITTPCLEIPISVFGRRMRSWRYHLGFLEIVVTEDGRFLCDIRAHIMPLKMTRPREYITI